ncbi:MAG: hypothetical protein AAGG72_02505 [Pseudomonadota bacterium]
MSALLLAGLLVGACANNNRGVDGPRAKPLAQGQTCKGLRNELRNLDRRGVPDKVERMNAGRRLSAKDRQLAQRYNQLLDDYLGARCHA